MKEEEMHKKIYSEYTLDIKVIEAIEEQKMKHHAILEYLLNKNSYPVQEGGLDYVKSFEEIEDYCNYLIR